MKRFAYFAAMIFILMSSCTPEAGNIEPTATISVFPSATSTTALLPTATKRPSATPEIPTASITPMSIAPVSISPLALNEFNAGTEMKRLNVIGTGTAHDIQFSPDGKRFAVATGRGIYLYNGMTFEQNGFIDVNDSVTAIAFSQDGNVLAVAVDGKASLWNANSGKQLISLDGGMVWIYKLTYGRGGYVAALGSTCRGCGSQQLGMILWDARTGRQIFSQRDIWYATKALAFTYDGERLYFGGQDGLTIVETANGQLVEYDKSQFGFPSPVNSPGDLVFNNDDTKLFITDLGEDGKIVDADVITADAFPFCDSYLTKSNTKGACSTEKKFLIFDLSNGETIETIDAGMCVNGWSMMFTLSPDSRYLACGIEDFVSIFDTQTGQLLKNLEFTNFDNIVVGIALVDNTEKYVGAMENPSGQINVIDLQSGESLRTFGSDCCEIKGFAFAPDQITFATIDKNMLRLWRLDTGQAIYEIDLKEDFSGPIAFSPNGKSIFLTHAVEDYLIKLNLQSKEIIKMDYNAYPYSYADPFAVENYHFDNFGNLVMFSYDKGTEGKYYPSFKKAITDETIIIPYNAYPDPYFIEAFSLSSNGQYIAFGNTVETLVWDVETMKLQSEFIGHERRAADGWYGRLKNLIFSPRSNLLVSVGWDQTTRLWNVKAGTELRTLNVCCSASITPDGRYLVTAGDGVIRVWGIP
jgi:WD40 repeat protein